MAETNSATESNATLLRVVAIGQIVFGGWVGLRPTDIAADTPIPLISWRIIGLLIALPGVIYFYNRLRQRSAPPPSEALSLDEANRRFVDQHGRSLSELAGNGDVLLLFLRHNGCTFCREALADLRRALPRLKQQGVRPVVVHMGDPETGQRFLASYGLAEVSRISDPACQLYRAYDLQRGSFWQLLGPAVWWPGFKATLLGRHLVGRPVGDGFQMPGAFYLSDGQVVRAYRHRTAADRPDYCALAIKSPPPA